MKITEYYVIVSKTNLMFVTEDGEDTEDVFAAEHYKNIQDAEEVLRSFDEPENFELYLVRTTISTKFELIRKKE